MLEGRAMSETNGKPQTTPGDGWVPAIFFENRPKFPDEQLTPFEGRYVAFSLDGTRIVASGADYKEIHAALDSAGIAGGQAVIEYIDAPV
jgi:hypothetical protein